MSVKPPVAVCGPGSTSTAAHKTNAHSGQSHNFDSGHPLALFNKGGLPKKPTPYLRWNNAARPNGSNPNSSHLAGSNHLATHSTKATTHTFSTGQPVKKKLVNGHTVKVAVGPGSSHTNQGTGHTQLHTDHKNEATILTHKNSSGTHSTIDHHLAAVKNQTWRPQGKKGLDVHYAGENPTLDRPLSAQNMAKTAHQATTTFRGQSWKTSTGKISYVSVCLFVGKSGKDGPRPTGRQSPIHHCLGGEQTIQPSCQQFGSRDPSKAIDDPCPTRDVDGKLVHAEPCGLEDPPNKAKIGTATNLRGYDGSNLFGGSDGDIVSSTPSSCDCSVQAPQGGAVPNYVTNAAANAENAAKNAPGNIANTATSGPSASSARALVCSSTTAVRRRSSRAIPASLGQGSGGRHPIDTERLPVRKLGTCHSLWWKKSGSVPSLSGTKFKIPVTLHPPIFTDPGPQINGKQVDQLGNSIAKAGTQFGDFSTGIYKGVDQYFSKSTLRAWPTASRGRRRRH